LYSIAYDGPVPMPMARGGGMVAFAMAESAPMAMMDGPAVSKADMKEAKTVRKLFPETWLWETKEAT